MSVRAASVLHDGFVEEIARLDKAGFSLVPLGRGPDGKAPLVSFAGTARLPLKQVLAPMHRMGSTCYGIRLGGFAVIDCDDDDPELVQLMEARFGASPVHVLTPRGRHLYYRAPNLEQPVFPNLKAEGLAVDIKRGPTSYVMGPGSVRPDGGAYLAARGVLGQDELPVLHLASSAAPTQRQILVEQDTRFAKGTRHEALKKAAVAMVHEVDSAEAIFNFLRKLRDRNCEAPDSVPDEEVRSLAEWAWRCRLEGRVYHGRQSEVRVSRYALDLLDQGPNASDAIALYVRLVAIHGHRPGYAFVLDHAGMRAAGHTDLSRERFTAARNTLLNQRLLQVASSHAAGVRSRNYQLARPMPSAANVVDLRGTREGAERV